MDRRTRCTFDSLDLIELVKENPCIWDKTHEDYKDRMKKERAWKKIYSSLIRDYKNFTEEEREKAGKAVINKWKNIRDAFMYSLKRKSSDGRTKKYIYFDQMRFLLKTLEKDDTESGISDNVESQEKEEDTSVQPESAKTTPTLSFVRQKRRKTFESSDETHTETPKFSEVTFQPQLFNGINEDTSFFASITPCVQNFTEDEKLEFRIDVLNLIKSIKEKRGKRNYDDV